MIERLRICNLALVEEVELEFGPGLNLLTGETGAGKSIVLGALALLAGARADREAIREPADEAWVEAVFDVRRLPELVPLLEERGLPAEDGSLIVRRSIQRAGRSRAWVGGRLVPVATLGELFEGRIEVSSQHASQALLRPEVQGRLLDRHGGLEGLRQEVEIGVRELREQAAELASLRRAAGERARREDFLRFQIQEIEEADLAPDEPARLASEHARLVHAERLGTEMREVAALLAGEPEAVPGGVTAADRLAETERLLTGLVRLDEELAPLVQRISGALFEVQDLAREAERYADGVETDPQRLVEVEERIGRLERLRRKYGATVPDILGFRDEAAAELAALGGNDDRMHKLEEEQEVLLRRVRERAEALSRGRRQAARSLGRALEQAVRELALEEARAEVVLLPVSAEPGLPCGPSGAEGVELRFSANRGEEPRPLRKVVSGGELSRVFLAQKKVLRGESSGRVLVFDEVDAGIGGAVAERVGGVLGSLARDHQVLCITHLPQIAAQPGVHFRVLKEPAGERTRTRVQRLGDEERVEELARMAAGRVPSDETRRHARALLEEAGAGRRRSGRR